MFSSSLVRYAGHRVTAQESIRKYLKAQQDIKEKEKTLAEFMKAKWKFRIGILLSLSGELVETTDGTPFGNKAATTFLDGVAVSMGESEVPYGIKKHAIGTRVCARTSLSKRLQFNHAFLFADASLVS